MLETSAVELQPLTRALERLSRVKLSPPVVWDGNTQRLSLSLSLKEKCLLTLNVVQECFFMGTLYMTAPLLFQHHDHKIGAQINLIGFIISYSAMQSLRLLTFIYRSDIVVFINGLFMLERSLKSEGFFDFCDKESEKTEAWGNPFLGKTLKVTEVLTWLSGPVFVLNLIQPEADLNVGYALFGRWHWAGIVYSFMGGWMCFNAWTLLSFHLIVFITYSWGTTRSLSLLTHKLSRRQIRGDSALLLYRRFQLTHNLFNQSIGNTFLPFGVTFGALIVIVTLFQVLTFHRALGLAGIFVIGKVSLMLTIGITLLFALTSKLSEGSSTFLSAVAKVNGLESGKYYQGLSTSFAGFFRSTPRTPLTFYSIVSQNVITLILSYSP